MTVLPNSYSEKAEAFSKPYAEIPTWMFVHELRSLLEQLKPDDWLTPNLVGNLSIGRDGYQRSVGVINFFRNEVEWFDEQAQDLPAHE